MHFEKQVFGNSRPIKGLLAPFAVVGARGGRMEKLATLFGEQTKGRYSSKRRNMLQIATAILIPTSFLIAFVRQEDTTLGRYGPSSSLQCPRTPSRTFTFAQQAFVLQKERYKKHLDASLGSTDNCYACTCEIACEILWITNHESVVLPEKQKAVHSIAVSRLASCHCICQARMRHKI